MRRRQSAGCREMEGGDSLLWIPSVTPCWPGENISRIFLSPSLARTGTRACARPRLRRFYLPPTRFALRNYIPPCHPRRSRDRAILSHAQHVSTSLRTWWMRGARGRELPRASMRARARVMYTHTFVALTSSENDSDKVDKVCFCRFGVWHVISSRGKKNL